MALEAALGLARSIFENGPLAVAASKRIMNESASRPVDRMFELQVSIADPVVHLEDAQEGARAFAEKRAPVWLGR